VGLDCRLSSYGKEAYDALGTGKLQVLLIPGVMKCGTSSLFQSLAEHPNVCPSLQKEPEFFSRHQSHGMDLSEYLDAFDPDPDIHRILLDGSSGYAKPYEEAVPQRIRDYGIDPIVVFALRNPFDRIVSQMNHRRHYHNDGDLTDYVISLSDYWNVIDRFSQCFDRLWLTSLETLQTDPAEIQLIQEFAGLTPYPLSLSAENIGNYEQSRQLLADGEYALIHDRLAPGMARLHSDFGVDVSSWGFT
jgi:hypothetical protein